MGLLEPLLNLTWSLGVAAGLPHASEAGVVFMEAAVTDPEACGLYSCRSCSCQAMIMTIANTALHTC